MPGDVRRVRVLVDAEEDVEGVDEGALAGAGAGELEGLPELGVELDALKHPPAALGRVRVRAAEPGADLVVEDLRVASVPHREEQLVQIGDHSGERVQVRRDSANGDVVTDEGLVHRRPHETKRLDTPEFYPGGREVEFLLVARAGEERETPEVVEGRDWGKGLWAPQSPVVEHVVGIRQDGW